MSDPPDDAVWTYRVPIPAAAEMTFAVKDNIDVAGIPTTLAAPTLGYVPDRSAESVERLLASGAVFAGKTNLDQFATGLVGTRSPYYGIVRNPIDPAYIAGGSSSGSAVAVATGAVRIALGTDTAGSGRVPAACCGIVGLNPTVGLVSTDGVFPASPSFDCVSVFTTTCADAAAALTVLVDDTGTPSPIRRIGVPTPLEWFGDDDARVLFELAIGQLRDLGHAIVEVPIAPLLVTGALLYGSALLAERAAAFAHLFARDPDAVDPTVRSIIESAGSYSATDAFHALARLRACRLDASQMWSVVDAIAVPTITRHPTIEEVLADPFGPNRELGTYTAFVNLLGWDALAVPAGTRATGLPFGISLIGPGGTDTALLDLGAEFLGEPPIPSTAAVYDLAVVGAHLTGQPLNHQLTDRGAQIITQTTTAAAYRLYALSTTPPKPGLVYDPRGGIAIELEVWRLSPAAFASFVDEVPRPLAIGTVELANGTTVNGFVCEPGALADAEEITQFGAWRKWLASRTT